MICNDVPFIEMFRGELETSREDEVLSHLEECAACREQLKTMAIIEAACRVDPRDKTQSRFALLAASIVLAALGSISYLFWQHPNVASTSTASLASEEKHPYFPLHTRSFDESEIRQQAFKHYAEERFSIANEWFKKLPPSAEILFFSGVSHYLLQEYSQAEDHLRKALELEPGWRAPVLWYQAQIYLKTNQAQLARITLQDLAHSGEVPYQQQALNLLQRLEEFK